MRVAVETMGEWNAFVPLLLKMENSTVGESCNMGHVHHPNFFSGHVREVKR